MPRYVYSRTLADAQEGTTQDSGALCVGWARVSGAEAFPITGTPFTPQQMTDCGAPVPMDTLIVEAPTHPQAKLVCAARNYRKHALELSNPVPEEPLVFLKPRSAVVGPGAAIALPTTQSELVHHEGELAVVMGRRACCITAGAAEAHILGYTLMNDVTARDLQRRDGCFSRAKGFDTFAPLGPWIDTDFRPGEQRLRVHVNGELRQDGRLDEMIFDVLTLVSWVSHIMTLEPGDIIATGTPSGVGVLTPGDTVSVDIEQLGVLTNPVIARG